MRRGHVLAVSSALLFLSIVPAPCHVGPKAADLPGSDGCAVISELYPCALLDDEYLVVCNNGGAPLNLLNWSVSDGEGSLIFRCDTWVAPGGFYTLSMNSSAYWAAFGRSPDWSPSCPNASAMIGTEGRFRLADDGDSVSLFDYAGALADFVVYGNCSERNTGWNGANIPAPRPGEVLKRIGAPQAVEDTDARVDWLPFREYRYGYTELRPFETTLPPGAVVGFVSPDSSLGIVLDAIASSERTIRLCSYELDSSPLCSALMDAVARGVSVRALVDGAPAGGISERARACLSALSASGASVLLVNGNMTRDAVQHVGALHAKYIVADSFRSIVTSENFVEDGIPSDSVCGNRGWGVRIESADVARYVEGIFDSDSRSSRPDVFPWSSNPQFDPRAKVPPPVKANHTAAASPALASCREAKVTIVPSPDSSVLSPYIVDWISRSSSMACEQFQADVTWRSRWDGVDRTSPVIECVENAIAKGADVKLLFDSSWFNIERNNKVMEHIAAYAARVGAFPGLRLLEERSPISLLHNKGAVFDAKVAMVSSNNWVCSSYAKNRELTVFVESEEISRYFLRAFDFDWEPDTSPPDASAGEDMSVYAGQTVALTAFDSVDDRAVVHWYWDLGADGTFDGFSEQFEFRPMREGTVEVELVVEDGWGNRAWDSVTITVKGLDSVSSEQSMRMSGWLWALAAACSSLGACVGCAIARRRMRQSRKINQPRAD